MKLMKLHLENFQGAKDELFDFRDGMSAVIYGDNATGKTTVYNALTWLLFDKASTAEAKGFSPKTRGADGTLHHMNHTVSATFLLEGGIITTLQKTLREVYRKKRGSKQDEFSGNTVDYFIDGVPVKQNEYMFKVQNYCGGDPEKTKMLTMPFYFPEMMPWEARRKILLEVCGNISDEDVIRRNRELAELQTYLAIDGTDRLHTVDEYRKIATARRKELNKKLDEIPGLIAEADRAMPDVTGLTEEGIRQEIDSLQKEVKALNEKRASCSESASSAEIRQKIAELKASLASARADYLDRQAREATKANSAITEAQDEVARRRRHKMDLEEKLSKEREELRKIKAAREELIAQYRAVSKEKWNTESEICPTCGQRFPADKVEELMEEFNLRKSERLEAINVAGKKKASKEMVEGAERSIITLEAMIQDADEAIRVAEAKADELFAKRRVVKLYEDTEECAGWNRLIQEQEEALRKKTGFVSEAMQAVEHELFEANDALQTAMEKRTKLDYVTRQRTRIRELEEKEKQYAVEFEHIEKGLHLCDLFIRTKVSMLTTSINERFETLRFQLFEQKNDGELRETCEVLVPSPDGAMVPFSTANSAARVNAGIEIISALSRHWGVSMPVFLDNAEGVTRPYRPEGCQLIRLAVSEKDKVLRLELEGA